MNPTFHQPDALDLLIDASARDLANAAAPNDFATRLKQRSFHMTSQTLPSPLLFTTAQRTRTPKDSRTFAGAFLLHAAAILAIVFGIHQVHQVLRPKVEEISLVDPAVPLPVMPKAVVMGGGGGQKGPTPVTRGNPPKFEAQQLNPPKIAVNTKVNIPASVDVQKDLKMAKSDIPQFGMPNSPLVGMSMGNGSGGGLGSGKGNGLGPGSGGNMGGGIKRIGGGVSAPEVLFAPEPEFSEEARKAKVSGDVLVYLQVDTLGRPTHVRVIRGIGMGLDERALAAVRQYRFKPAMENGQPVAVEMNVSVNFTIY
jgi:protein TonB